jgi:hypothetical protein
MPSPESIPPGLSLVAYAEQLCKGARVLIVGKSAVTLANAVLDRGARLVHVFERDPARRAEALARSSSRAVTFGSPDEGLREGFFDLVLVENLANEPDHKETVRTLSKMMAPRAAALIAAPNPEATRPLLASAGASRPLDYYALYDAVAAALPHVRMIGQVPFVGYALIDFAAESEPAPVFDTSLVPARGEEPDYFVAFGAQHPRMLDEYVVVQIPSADVARGELSERPASPSEVPVAVPRGETPAPFVPAASVLPATPAPSPEPPRRTEDARIAELERQLSRQEAWIAELEARAATADERADSAEAELDELRERSANREQVFAADTGVLRQERDEARAEVERLKRRTNDLSDMLELKQTELTALANDPESAKEISQLEAQLKEQGQRLRGLEADLREAERTGRALVRKLMTQPAPAPSPPQPVAESSGVSTDSAVAVAERLAEAEAELVSLRWSLSMLTRVRTGASLAPGAQP